MNAPSSEFSDQLRMLLERRLVVIGDQQLRENDPARQLEQLQSVSEEIAALQEREKASLPPRLKHYLERASYSKALAWMKGEEE